MKKINLKQTRVFTDSYREKYLLVDMSKGLLQRIRESEGEIEITSAEESVLLSLVGGEKINGLPADALLFELNKGKFEERYREGMSVDEECGVMRDVVDEAYNEMENVNKQE